MKKYKLYALTEPDNIEIIRYIGVTQQILLKRLGQHLSKMEERKTRRDEWMLKLEFPPRIIILNSFDSLKEALNAEKEMITKTELKGIILFNEQSNYNRRWKEMKPVHQYDYEGNYIRSYSSAKEACVLNLFLKYKCVNACCNGTKASHYKFRFSYIKKKKINTDRKVQSHLKPIHQYDLKGNFIETFLSAKYVLLKYPNFKQGQIWGACTKQKNAKTAYGFKWSYDKV